MNELDASSADVFDLIGRLTRAGYCVTFEPRAVNFLPAVTIIIESAGEHADDFSPNRYWRRVSPFPSAMASLPLILHPYGADGILKELERAANLLTPVT